MTAVGATAPRSPTQFQRPPGPADGEFGESRHSVTNDRSGNRKPIAAARTRFSLLGPLFIISLASPLYMYVGPARLVPYRILLLAALVPLTLIWFTRKAGPIRAPDILMLLAALWGALALLATSGSAGIEPATVFFVETFGAYLLARVTIRTYADFYRMVQTLFWLLVIILPFAVIETFADRALLHELLAAVGPTTDRMGNELRYGLHRASVVFEHPILFGTFCASAFALVYFVAADHAGPMRRAVRAGIVTMAALCSISSGAMAAIALQVALITWHYITRGVKHRWRLLGGLGAICYVVVDLLSNRSPLEVFISYLTISSQTGYFRIMIWDYGSAEVLRHPLFGIGMAEWTRPNWMPASVDNFWLLTAMRYGLPVFVFFAGSIVMMMVGIGKMTFAGPELSGARRGLFISLCGMIIAGCTVHYWNAAYVWLIFLVGSGMWMMDAGKQPAQGPAPEEPIVPHLRSAGRPLAGLRRS